MDLFINDLSLHGQFADPQAFRRSLEEVVRCRTCAGSYGRTLRVPRTIVDRHVIGLKGFRQALQATGDRTFVSLIISWIAKNGPFVEDDLQRNSDEYLTIENNTIVTEEAIGEAATRHFNGLPVGLVSFAPSDYQYTPIEIDWHRSDAHVQTGELHNVWSEAALQTYLERYQNPPQTWKELLQQLPRRFPQLTFLPNLADYLDGDPFSPYAVERTFVLLDVLNRLKTCFDADGRRTPEGEALVENYFRRKKAHFTDSSDQEKNDPRFREAMTFTDLQGAPIECFWHGKIKTPQYRIHFSYPIEKDAPLYIAYIGQKLTKK